MRILVAAGVFARNHRGEILDHRGIAGRTEALLELAVPGDPVVRGNLAKREITPPRVAVLGFYVGYFHGRARSVSCSLLVASRYNVHFQSKKQFTHPLTKQIDFGTIITIYFHLRK